MVLKLFHLSVLSIYLFTMWYDQNYIDFPFPSKEIEQLPLKGRSMFLTFWCFITQTLYFGLAAVIDILGPSESDPNRKKSKIRAIKDAMFSVAFPMATYVTVVFWTLYHIDRELIFPERLDKVFPPWVNHVLHTSVLVFMLVEMILCSREYVSRINGTSLLVCLNFAYITCLFAVFNTFGVWVYPLFGVLSWPARLLFLTVNVLVMYGLYTLCEKMNEFASILRAEIQLICKTNVC